MAHLDSSNKLVLLGPDAATQSIYIKLTNESICSTVQHKNSDTPSNVDVWRIPEKNKQQVLLSITPHAIGLCISADDISSNNVSEVAQKHKEYTKYMEELATSTLHNFPKVVPIIVYSQEGEVDQKEITAFLAELNKTIATTENKKRDEIDFASAVYCRADTDGNQLLAKIIGNNGYQLNLTEFERHPDEPKSWFFAQSAACAKESPKAMLAAGTAAGAGVGLILATLVVAATGVIAWPALLALAIPVIIGAAIGLTIGYGQRAFDCGSSAKLHMA
ncbi:MAG: hypothetical protein CMF50_04725 [Legionellales bacterium]|nr:hypothetical protein [Legionellales bacterium]